MTSFLAVTARNFDFRGKILRVLRNFADSRWLLRVI